MKGQILEYPWVEYGVILAYLLMLLVVGAVFKNFNKNSGDYFRSGSQGTWWLVGMSSFMAGISAFTFTGNGGAAFEAGWSVIIIYVANCCALLFHFFFLAPWFRQLRTTTFPEAIELRFGPVTQQVYAAIAMILFIITGGIWLYGLAIFTASAFGFPIELTIPVLGVVVLFYSTTGGKWAVMAADFVQGLILIGMTLLLSALCLIHFGGWGGLTEAIVQSGLEKDFRLFKEADAFPGQSYTWQWALAVFVVQTILICSVQQGVKYFAVKDGREARRAALLTLILMALGAMLWFIPPIAARILYADEVMASGMTKPAEAAVAIIAGKMLPTGLIGMMVVAMFSATMSSMDAGLNGNAAMFVRDFLPALFRKLKRPLPSERVQVGWGRWVTIAFGMTVIWLALRLSRMEGTGIFEFVINLGPILIVPMSIPLLLCLFIRRVPAWSAIASMAVTLIPSVLSLVAETPWTLAQKTFWSALSGAGVFLLSGCFWSQATTEYRQKVDAFFERMHRPVEFASEVGASNDVLQLKIMGRFAFAVGVFILLLLAAPNDFGGRIAIAALASFMLGTGSIMHWMSKRLQKSLL
jgi:Na+/proline symporter